MPHQLLLSKLRTNSKLLLHAGAINSVSLLIAHTHKVASQYWELNQNDNLKVFKRALILRWNLQEASVTENSTILMHRHYY